jgi:hypothetical protein
MVRLTSVKRVVYLRLCMSWAALGSFLIKKPSSNGKVSTVGRRCVVKGSFMGWGCHLLIVDQASQLECDVGYRGKGVEFNIVNRGCVLKGRRQSAGLHMSRAAICSSLTKHPSKNVRMNIVWRG